MIVDHDPYNLCGLLSITITMRHCKMILLTMDFTRTSTAHFLSLCTSDTVHLVTLSTHVLCNMEEKREEVDSHRPSIYVLLRTYAYVLR